MKGWLIAILSGILSSGPIYLWYPLLADKDVQQVIVGKAGPNFRSALEERGIIVQEKGGIARDAL